MDRYLNASRFCLAELSTLRIAQQLGCRELVATLREATLLPTRCQLQNSHKVDLTQSRKKRKEVKTKSERNLQSCSKKL
jgi:hypothetical protein